MAATEQKDGRALQQQAPPVYEFLAEGDRYRMLGLVGELEPPLLQQLGGVPLGHRWSSLEIRVINATRGLPPSDIVVWETDAPVITPVAWGVLSDLLVGNAEPLPLIGKPGSHYVVNVTRLLPGLLEDQSEVFRFPNGPIGDVSRYAIDPQNLGPAIFKFAEWPNGRVFVLDAFVRRVAELGLTGARFRHIWP